jgi:hypothetical protein
MKRRTLLLFISLASIYSSAQQSCLVGDCADGWGLATTIRGSNYHGYFQDGKPAGMGSEQMPSGVFRIGTYADGQIAGFGMQVNKDGSVTLGYFNYGQLCAESLTIDNSQVINAQMNRNGIFINDNAQEYFAENAQGECKGNCESGFGSIRLPDKGVFTGYFDNRGYAAMGRLALDNGAQYVGEFKRNEMDGYGLLMQADEPHYFGQWKNSQRDGLGFKMQNNLMVENGVFEKDILKKAAPAKLTSYYPTIKDRLKSDKLLEGIDDNLKNPMVLLSEIHAAYLNLDSAGVSDTEIGSRLCGYLEYIGKDDPKKLAAVLEPYSSYRNLYDSMKLYLPINMAKTVDKLVNSSGSKNTTHDLTTRLPGYGVCKACNGTGSSDVVFNHTSKVFSHSVSRKEFNSSNNTVTTYTTKVYYPVTTSTDTKTRCVNCRGYGLVKY